jgi:predicted nucleotidyltransferase
LFEEILSRIARELDSAGLPYMVIGGQAVLRYGEPRLTRDIDITLGVGIEGVPRVEKAVNDLNLKMLVEDPDAFVRRTFVLPAQDEASGIRVDFVFSFSEYERQAIARATSVDMIGVPVRFAALEDVIIHKIVAGRPRDLDKVSRSRSPIPAGPPSSSRWPSRLRCHEILFEVALDGSAL